MVGELSFSNMCDELLSFGQEHEEEVVLKDIANFTNAITDKLLEEDWRRQDKRKYNKLDEYKSLKKIRVSNDEDELTIEEEEMEKVIHELRRTETAVCLGFEVDCTMKCRLCGFEPTVGSNLYAHIKKTHYECKLKLCKIARPGAMTANKYRGCRKVFIEQTFDFHTCTDDDPELLDIYTTATKDHEQEEHKNLGHDTDLVGPGILIKSEAPLFTSPQVQIPSNDQLKANTTLTLFLETTSFHRSKIIESNATSYSVSQHASMEVLLSMSCHVYPQQVCLLLLFLLLLLLLLQLSLFSYYSHSSCYSCCCYFSC